MPISQPPYTEHLRKMIKIATHADTKKDSYISGRREEHPEFPTDRDFIQFLKSNEKIINAFNLGLEEWASAVHKGEGSISLNAKFIEFRLSLPLNVPPVWVILAQ